jgi:hypothetical protein
MRIVAFASAIQLSTERRVAGGNLALRLPQIRT